MFCTWEKKKKGGQKGKKDSGRGVSQGQTRYGGLVKRSGLISGIKEKVLVLSLAREELSVFISPPQSLLWR